MKSFVCPFCIEFPHQSHGLLFPSLIAKAAKATKKKEAMKESCNVPANAPILMAFEEMADVRVMVLLCFLS